MVTTMKHMPIKRLLSLLLAATTLLTLGSALALPTAASSEVSVQNGTGSPGAIPFSSPFAYRAKVNGEFTGFAYSMPTWATNDSACTLALFKWDGSLSSSLQSQPIASKRFDPLVDNATNRLDFDPQPAGEYLFAIIELRGTVGVYGNQNCTDTKGFSYVGKVEQSIEPNLTITFTNTPAEPFGQCESMYNGNHTSPEEYVIPESSPIYTHEVMPDTWVFTDGLGRTSLTNADVGDPREDKEVAMFYWTWHLGRPQPLNVNQAVEAYPEAVRDYNHPVWNQYPFQGSWNESIYGFYESDDAWVVRRQGELLANAGVDAIFTDNTNGSFTFPEGYHTVFQTWLDAMEGGVNPPKVSFMVSFIGREDADTVSQLRSMYLDFFRDGTYHPLWYYLDGKPMLMSHGNTVLNNKDNLEKEIKDFFTWRGGYSGYINQKPANGQWGWLSIYPQAAYHGTVANRKAGVVEQVTVGTAMNHNYELNMISAMSGNYVMGRSYTHDYQNRYEVEGKEASKWGYNFAEQWNHALELDPKIIFITGWNEWAMAHAQTWPEGYESAVSNAFCDQFNDEFSRDIEPTKGDLKDHYYYQMVNFIRQYKGVRPIPTPSGATAIDITRDNTQWSTVEPYYAAYVGNTGDRDSADGWGDLTYSEYSGRNDIIGARVARDDSFVYFYVECNEDITPYTDPLWMVLYIDSDQQNQGWETFDYVLNKTSPTAEKAYLERFTGNGYETEIVGEVDYTVDGKYMQVKVPKSMLKLPGYDFTINFAWTDNVHDEADRGEHGDKDYVYTTFSGDIMDFYISGDVAPSGRFKYSYVSTTENAGAGAGAVTETTDEPSETHAPEKKGCTSAVGAGAALLATAMATAVALRKKDQ